MALEETNKMLKEVEAQTGHKFERDDDGDIHLEEYDGHHCRPLCPNCDLCLPCVYCFEEIESYIKACGSCEVNNAGMVVPHI